MRVQLLSFVLEFVFDVSCQIFIQKNQKFIQHVLIFGHFVSLNLRALTISRITGERSSKPVVSY